jgi:hypothetical protein
MRARIVVTALAVAISSACATSGGSTSSAKSGGSRSQEFIGEAEIAQRAQDVSNALAIIEKLRPQMLRSRGATSPTNSRGEDMLPRVYVDDVSYGNINSLTNLNAGQVKEIRFIKGPDATTRWGTGHMAGVILVTTKK